MIIYHWNFIFSVTLDGSNRPGDSFFEGSTYIGYYAKDKSGNMATCNFVIHINGKLLSLFIPVYINGIAIQIDTFK